MSNIVPYTNDYDAVISSALLEAEKTIIEDLHTAQTSMTRAFVTMYQVIKNQLWRDRTLADGTSAHKSGSDWLSYISEEYERLHHFKLTASSLRSRMWAMDALIRCGFDFTLEEAANIPQRVANKLLTDVVQVPGQRNQLARPVLREGVSGWYEGITEDESADLAEQYIREAVEGAHDNPHQWLTEISDPGIAVYFSLWEINGKVSVVAEGVGTSVPGGSATAVMIPDWVALPGWLQNYLNGALNMHKSIGPDASVDA